MMSYSPPFYIVRGIFHLPACRISTIGVVLMLSRSHAVISCCELPSAGFSPHDGALLCGVEHAKTIPHSLQNGVSHQQSLQLQQPSAEDPSSIPSQALQNMQFGPLDFSSGVHPAQPSHVGHPSDAQLSDH